MTKVRTYQQSVSWQTKQTTQFVSVSGSANKNCCIGPNLVNDVVYIDDDYDADEEMERRIEEYEAELSEEELQRLKEYDQLIEDYDYRQGGYAGVECHSVHRKLN